jgi:hypothetical protein
MENETISKRRLAIILILAAVVIFVGLVWLAVRYLPLNLLGLQNPTGTASVQVQINCIYPLDYWRAHPELYPPQIFLGNVVYKERELEALLAGGSQDPVQQLKVQLVVAFLNGLVGADQSAIQPTVFEAYAWLVEHPAGSQLSEEELAQSQQMDSALHAYNQGLAGVAACEANPVQELTNSVEGTVTQPVSQTPSGTPTHTPTGTPTPKVTLTQETLPSPSATSTPTAHLAGNFSPTPTQYLPPQPTKTPTTRPPTSTATKIPATPTFTPPPPPSPTYTLPPLPTPSHTPIPPG